MADFPSQPQLSLAGAGTIFSTGYGAPTGMLQNITAANCASAVYTLANYAIYVPFVIEGRAVTAYQMGTYNGTVVSGNMDLGIYDSNAVRLTSAGSTAQAGVSTIQVVNVTDAVLTPGTYYMALSCDNITATFFRGTPSNVLLGALGVKDQTLGSVTLPNPATMTISSRAYIPSFFLNFHPTVF